MKKHYTHEQVLGIGMTSQRTRDRLVDRLREKGIANEAVLEAIRNTRPPSLSSVASYCTRSAAAMVRRAMAFDQGDRYAAMADLGADLTLLSQSRGTQAAADEGGWIRRAFTQLSYMSSGYPYEYKSGRTFLGMPLVHINVGIRAPRKDYRHARGWFAIGTTASGGLAIASGASFGLVAVAAPTEPLVKGS